MKIVVINEYTKGVECAYCGKCAEEGEQWAIPNRQGLFYGHKDCVQKEVVKLFNFPDSPDLLNLI